MKTRPVIENDFIQFRMVKPLFTQLLQRGWILTFVPSPRKLSFYPQFNPWYLIIILILKIYLLKNQKRVWFSEIKKNLCSKRPSTKCILPTVMINENIENVCGGSLYVVKCELHPSAQLKTEVLQWHFQIFDLNLKCAYFAE